MDFTSYIRVGTCDPSNALTSKSKIELKFVVCGSTFSTRHSETILVFAPCVESMCVPYMHASVHTSLGATERAESLVSSPDNVMVGDSVVQSGSAATAV